MRPAAAWLLAAALWAGCLAPGPWWLAPTGAGLAVAAVGLRREGRVLALLAVALLLAGSGLAGGRLALQQRAVLAHIAERPGVAEIEATAVTEARETAYGSWQVVRVTRVDGAPLRERAVIRLPAGTEPPALGARVTARVAVEPLGWEGFDRHLRGLHAVAALRPSGRLAVAGEPARFIRATTAVRDRTRAAAAERLDADRAALLTALVTGDRRGESPDRRAQFAASSLTHLVVVSGKHVGIMLGGVLALAALAGAGPRTRSWLALAALGWYVVLVRWQPSVLRAGLMAALVLAAGLAGRRGDGRHALGIAVVMLLLADPLLGRHLGFALSVSATAGVLVVAPWFAGRLPGPRWLRLPAAVCLGAQVGVTPLLVHLEGGVPLAALPANLLAVPAAGAAQAVGLLAAVVAQVSIPAGGLVAALAAPPLTVVLRVAESFADWPTLTPAALVSPVAAALAGALLLRRHAPRAAWGLAAAAALLAVIPAIAPAPRVDALTVTQIDIGQGDAVLVEVPAGDGQPAARLLYDGGPDGAALAHLRARRIRRLDAVALSHPHHDHTGGLPAVLRRLDVGALLVGPHELDERGVPSAHEAHAVARRAGVPIVPLAAGDRLPLGGAQLVALSPPGDGAVGTDLNEISLVLRLDHPDGRVLLTGDAEVLAQALMLRERDALRADVLKVPHHGGNTNAPGFLAAAGAAVALIGVGADNPYGHPHPEVLDDLAAAGSRVYRTDLHGSIAVRLQGGRVVDVRVEREAGAEPAAAGAAHASVGHGVALARRVRAGRRPSRRCASAGAPTGCGRPVHACHVHPVVWIGCGRPRPRVPRAPGAPDRVRSAPSTRATCTRWSGSGAVGPVHACVLHPVGWSAPAPPPVACGPGHPARWRWSRGRLPCMNRPAVYLVTGPAELLVHRAGDRLVDELRAEGDIEVVDIAAPDLTEEAGFPDLRTGSLFGARRVIVVRQAGDLPAWASGALVAELQGGPLDAAVILLATSTGRLQKLAKAVKEHGGRIDVDTPAGYDERGWKDLVAGEFGRHGRQASRAAIDAIYAHAGTDVAVVAEKVAQVCATAPAGTIDAEHVEAAVIGHGSRGSFAIADAMCKRRPAEAVTLLRGALEAGDDPVMILGALVYRVRALVALAGQVEPGRIGLSVSRGQARHLERDRQSFQPGELTMAYRVLADADAELKGGELPPVLVIERAVEAIATPRGLR